MGFLESGIPLDWEVSTEFISRVKRDGLLQLLHTYGLNASRSDPVGELKWGDELEYTLVNIDPSTRTARVCIDGPEILAELRRREAADDWDNREALVQAANVLSGSNKSYLGGVDWHPEYGRHMVECTPALPFSLASIDSFMDVEHNMISRRLKLQSVLPNNTFATSLAAFPRLGLADYTMTNLVAPSQYRPELSAGSRFIVDTMINPHPRFPTLTKNINRRRGVKLSGFVPAYRDHFTDSAASGIWTDSVEALPPPAGPTPGQPSRAEIEQLSLKTPNPVRGQIYLDHFGFGMGMCCLQVTFGTPDLKSARNLYDQMSVLAPLFLALSAATPALRGLLSDRDTRWPVLEQTCDCRTEEEVAGKLERTRYGGVGMYIGQSAFLDKFEAELNDVPLPQDPEALELLRSSKIMDERMARHFASLWVRDPLVIFSDKIELDNKIFVDHFENIQSTNWNSVRFKPPPPCPPTAKQSPIGWRVELRTPDIQLSDFENAALSCLAAILAMGILHEGWNFYLPISKSLENLATSHKRGSALKDLFWFPTRLLNPDGSSPLLGAPTSEQSYSPPVQMTLREIFLGTNRGGDEFEGLLNICDKFVSQQWRKQLCSAQAVEKYRIYSNYLRLRVLGQARTNAAVLRHFISAHPSYKHDSVVSEELNFEVCKLAVLAGFNLCPCTSAWGNVACLPSSYRHPCADSFNDILNLPIAKEILSITNPAAAPSPLATSFERPPLPVATPNAATDHGDLRCLSTCSSLSLSRQTTVAATEKGTPTTAASAAAEKAQPIITLPGTAGLEQAAHTPSEVAAAGDASPSRPVKRLKEKLNEEFDASLFLELEQVSR